MSNENLNLSDLMNDLYRFRDSIKGEMEYTKTLAAMESEAEMLEGYFDEMTRILEKYQGLHLEQQQSSIEVKPFDTESCKYPNNIMMDVRENLGLDSDDTSRDDYIMTMSRGEVLDAVMEYDGIIGYGYKMRSWIEDIYGIDLNDLPERERPDMQAGKWRALFVEPGQGYQMSNSIATKTFRLPHYAPSPLVVFYDMSANKEDFPNGQCVNSYYASTLLGRNDNVDLRTSGTGLWLDCDVKEWMISPEDMKPIAQWVGKRMEDYERRNPPVRESLNQMVMNAQSRSGTPSPESTCEKSSENRGL